MSRIFLEYTEKQLKAIKQLRRAYSKIKTVGLYVFNQYGTIQFFSKDEIDEINDDGKGIDQNDVVFEQLDLGVGEWSDDKHDVHFTEKGRKKYLVNDD